MIRLILYFSTKVPWRYNQHCHSRGKLTTFKLFAIIAPLAHISSLTFPSPEMPMDGRTSEPKFSCLTIEVRLSVGKSQIHLLFVENNEWIANQFSAQLWIFPIKLVCKTCTQDCCKTAPNESRGWNELSMWGWMCRRYLHHSSTWVDTFLRTSRALSG